MYKEVKEILEYIQYVRAYRPAPDPSHLERVANRIAKYCMWSSLGLFALLVVLVLFQRFIMPLASWARVLALLDGCLTELLMLPMLMAVPIAPITRIIRWKSWMLYTTLGEFESDCAYVGGMLYYSWNALQYTDFWLSQKVKRKERRILFIVGKKIAILQMILAIPVLAREFAGVVTLLPQPIQHFFHAGFLENVVIYGVAFIIGLALGCCVVKVECDQIFHQRQLLNQALKLKELDATSAGSQHIPVISSPIRVQRRFMTTTPVQIQE